MSDEFKDIPIPDVDYHLQEFDKATWYHQKIAVLQEENKQLIEKCQRLQTMVRHLIPEKVPNVLFIHGMLGEKDQNGMPAELLVVPAYGVDFSYIYKRTDKTTGPEW